MGAGWKVTAAAALLVTAVALAYLGGTWLTTPRELSRQEAVAKAVDAANAMGMAPVGTVWTPTFVEKEPGREFTPHYPGVQQPMRAPCMRPLNLSFQPCSEAGIWYVHLDGARGYYGVDVVVDSRLGTAAVVMGGSGGLKPLPSGITPFPGASP
ncbi:MAG TPA: hypothetical protein VF160_10885 [Candidatus Dormibacteraeota bacterium]